MGRNKSKSGKASKMRRHSSVDDLSCRPYRLPIDRNQIRNEDAIDCPQNGHEYLYMARKADDNLPPVMTATNVEFQQFINKYHNNARDYIVPALELPEIKMKNLLPTKAEIITYIEQYENARAKYEDCKKDMRSIPKHSLPSSYSPTIWFTYLFGKQINSSTPVNPVCNIDKCIFFTQEDCAYVISNFVQWITKKVVLPSDVTSWTFSVYSVMDCDPCETLLSDMRILTQFFINARLLIMTEKLELRSLVVNSETPSSSSPATPLGSPGPKNYVNFWGILLAAISSFFFSLTSLIVKWLHNVDPLELATVRFIGILLPTIPILIYKKQHPFH